MPRPPPLPRTLRSAARGSPPPVDTEAAAVGAALERLLDPAVVRAELAQALRSGRKRDRKLAVVPFLLAILWFVLLRVPSFADLLDRWRKGRLPRLGSLDVTSGAWSQRLDSVPHDWMLHLVTWLGTTLRGVRSPLTSRPRAFVRQLAPFAACIVAVDDTTLDALARKVTELATLAKGAAGTLAGRLACALDLETGTFAEVLFDSDSLANEKSHVRALLQRLPMDSLVLLDRGYYSFALFDWMTRHFLFFLTRLREKAVFEEIQVLRSTAHYRDRIVWLGHGADRAALPVRLIELFVDGAWHAYVTNVFDPTALTAPAAWALYEQRWQIEQAFFALKRVLGLAMLRPCKLNGVLLQVWATLGLYQVLQHLRTSVATAAAWHPDDVSWEMLLRRIEWYVQDKPAQTLVDWLCADVDGLRLKKRGVRSRRRRDLPAELLAACASEGARPEYERWPERRPRSHRPEPRRRGSRLEMAGLSLPLPAN